VALILLGADSQVTRRTFHEATKVTFFPMSEEEIRYYADSREPEGKAGAYAIQGLCARYISGIEGDYNNVVGLPVGRLYQEVGRLVAKEGLHYNSLH
jgi:septum formation protein